MGMDSELARVIAEIPFEDHHVHQPRKVGHALTVGEFRRPFTEASLAAVWERQIQTTVAYRWMIRELAGVLGVAPDEAAVLAARNGMNEHEYHRLLADQAKLSPAAWVRTTAPSGWVAPSSRWAAARPRSRCS